MNSYRNFDSDFKVEVREEVEEPGMGRAARDRRCAPCGGGAEAQ